MFIRTHRVMSDVVHVAANFSFMGSLSPGIARDRKSVQKSSSRVLPPNNRPGLAKTRSKESIPPVPSMGQPKISQRLNPKTVGPMGKEDHHKTIFSEVYSKGGIPCRLNHGSVKHSLTWIQAPAGLDYDPLYLTFLEGLRETEHPYTFIVREGLTALMDADGAKAKLMPLMPRMVSTLRKGLASHNKNTVLATLKVLAHLSRTLGPAMNSILGPLLPPVAAQVMKTDWEWRQTVLETLKTIEVHLGETALKLIKSKVPTYTSASGI
ncbi:parkin co-regulated protein-domain-containing protein [Polychytrium aggregatum]|uniref:parkin co-regulated protein-domain-containing protein n=1 Tax=Polychytrium aggregatum TaxID=110093 RepID=UPI0022FEAB5F|nr:parkin co-regulated protein-domain-containing protein [Polychytrium aggregatum]KAI9204385.1 parkin co-regulated protein-domain-containing protein [Polychytrium aggregatum]